MNRLRAYAMLIRLSLKNQLRYLIPFFAGKLFLVVILITFFSLYASLFGSRAEAGGFTLTGIVYYIAIGEIIEMSRVRIFFAISEEIKDGSCAYNLLRPISYFGYHFSNACGELLLNFFSTITIGLTTAVCFAGPDPGILRGIFLSLPVISGAVLLNFLVMFIIGLLAFQIYEVSPVYWLYQKFVFMFGGMLIPIDFLPRALQPFARALPSAYVAYHPAKLAVHFSWSGLIEVFAGQAAYAILLFTLGTLLYRHGVRRIQVFGG